MPGTLYAMIIKEKLDEALTNFRRSIAIDVERSEPSVDFFDSESRRLSIDLTTHVLQSDTSKRC